MTIPTDAGAKGRPLPDGAVVIRLAKPTFGGKVDQSAFTPSTKDKEADLKSVSVWNEALTTEEQAREFMGDNKHEYSLAPRLPAARIRALRPDPDSPDVPPLDVVWDPLDDLRPGAEGHAGITGLLRPAQVPNPYYKNLRAQLVDLANASLFQSQNRSRGSG